jgi:hypothetical protein
MLTSTPTMRRRITLLGRITTRSPEAIEERRRRREHRELMTDPSFHNDHQIQVSRSLDRGDGGCPYCA